MYIVRKFLEYFQVDRDAQKEGRNSDPGDAEGIAGALARALASRAKKLNTGQPSYYGLLGGQGG